MYACMYVVYAKMRARTSDSDPHGKRSIVVCLIYFFPIYEGRYFSEPLHLDLSSCRVFRKRGS